MRGEHDYVFEGRYEIYQVRKVEISFSGSFTPNEAIQHAHEKLRALAKEAVADGFKVGEMGIGRQVGGPWLSFFDPDGWYRGKSILAFERSLGSAFTNAEVGLLKDRVEAAGFIVLDHWNGAGCAKLSIKVEGGERTEPMEKEVRDKLLAPLPEGLK